MNVFNIQDLLLLKREISDLKVANAPEYVIDLRESQLREGTKKAIEFYLTKMKKIQSLLSHDKMVAKWILPRLSKDDWGNLIVVLEECQKWEAVSSHTSTCVKCGHHYVFQCTCH